ncbi:MAG TPA: cellulose-binding protein, partial [Vicinamibacteria bacterium]|nr:cellulose-binding protein [Vicinamibacteria bacterium]
MPRAFMAAVLTLVLAVAARAGELGTNLDAVVDYSPQYVFVDAFKQSREWITQTESTFDTNQAASLDLDADGWVRSIPSGAGYDRVATLLFFGDQPHYPSGTYIVTYEGSGILEYRFDAVKNETLSTAGRDVLAVTPNVGFAIVIRSTTPGNHLRNIRVWMPGFDQVSGPG